VVISSPALSRRTCTKSGNSSRTVCCRSCQTCFASPDSSLNESLNESPISYEFAQQEVLLNQVEGETEHTLLIVLIWFFSPAWMNEWMANRALSQLKIRFVFHSLNVAPIQETIMSLEREFQLLHGEGEAPNGERRKSSLGGLEESERKKYELVSSFYNRCCNRFIAFSNTGFSKAVSRK